MTVLKILLILCWCRKFDKIWLKGRRREQQEVLAGIQEDFPINLDNPSCGNFGYGGYNNYVSNFSGRFSGGRFQNNPGRGFYQGGLSGQFQGQGPSAVGQGPTNNFSGRLPLYDHLGQAPQNYFYQPGRGSGQGRQNNTNIA